MGKPASNTYKAKLCEAYQHYCKFNRIIWEKPINRPEEKGIQPPTDEQCKILIGGIKSELSVKVQLSVETGLRPCEMTIRVKQTTVTDPMAEARSIEQAEQESGEETSQEPESNEDTKIVSPQEKKEAELKEWQRTRNRINSIPQELKVGEPVLIVWGNIKKIETKVTFKKGAENENNLQSKIDQNSSQVKE